MESTAKEKGLCICDAGISVYVNTVLFTYGFNVIRMYYLQSTVKLAFAITSTL